MSKAVQHTFALTQFLNRQTIVFLIQEKSGFLAIHYIHHITNAIFRNFHVCIKFCSNETFYPAQTFFFPLLRITTLINTSNLNAIFLQNLLHQISQLFFITLHTKSQTFHDKHIFVFVNNNSRQKICFTKYQTAGRSIHRILSIIPCILQTHLKK